MDCMALWCTLGESNSFDQWKTTLLPNWFSRFFWGQGHMLIPPTFKTLTFFKSLSYCPPFIEESGNPLIPFSNSRAEVWRIFRRVVSLSIINMIYLFGSYSRDERLRSFGSRLLREPFWGVLRSKESHLVSEGVKFVWVGIYFWVEVNCPEVG